MWLLLWLEVGVLCLSAAADNHPGGCLCQPDARHHLSCHCTGYVGHDNFTNALPGRSIQVLSISNGDLEEFRSEAVANFKETLIDLSITRMEYLTRIDDGVFQDFPRMNYIRIVQTSISMLPLIRDLGAKKTMHIIDFESNKIKKIVSNNVFARVEQLSLDYNEIETIEAWAFNGSEIGKLSFRGNKALSVISKDAFRGLKSLRDLDLSETSISYLPTSGLEELEKLRLINTHTLKTIPSIYDLNKLEMAWLTYSFHCCAFQFPSRHNPERHRKYVEHIKSICDQLKQDRNRRTLDEGFGEILPDEETGYLPPLDNENHPRLGQFREHIGDGVELESSDEVFHETSAQLPTSKLEANCGNITQRSPVVCLPKPDVLNPCEDMMSWSWLRASVWAVLSFAILGNSAVLIVLALSKSETSVPRYLMVHLAFADLCMALYLLLLAIMDIVSTDIYFNYAYDWQRGFGCKVAGFLTVFASQLSLFTLCLLTIERWFAIRHALYTNRLDLSLASKIMAFGWVYSVTMAILPLVGISSYSSTSICLPMDTDGTGAVLYILLLLLTAGIGFVLICVCYIQIYLSLSYETRHSSTEGSVAHKMALLVITNFACWAPIAFFSLTAVLGYPLISVTQSKILLVFIYPINSCANPYLYAILTKQYRRDFVLLLARFGLCTGCAQRYRMVYSRPTSNITPTPLISAEVTV